MSRPWGEKAFSGYLGAGRDAWPAHDLADKFLAGQLHPHVLEAACSAVGQPLELWRHKGYDHGYHFIQSFMADHLMHHAKRLLP